MPKRTNHIPSKHVQDVRAQLVAFKGRYGDIQRITGIPVNWLQAFAQGLYCDPGHGRIETLARAIGFEMHYKRVKPAFEPKDREQDAAEMRKSIHRQVYGSDPI